MSTLALRTFIRRCDQQALVLTSRLPAGLRPLVVGLSVAGHPVTVALALALIALSRQPHAARLAVLGLLALPLSALLKQWFRRLRPATARALGLYNYSFPSGHSYSAVIAAGCFTRLAPAPVVWATAIAGILIASGVGLSRVYLGAHHATDVIAGWAAGLAVVGIIIGLT